MLRSIPYRAWLLLIFLLALGRSLIDPVDRQDMLLEHLPTFAAVGFLLIVDRRQPLSNRSYTLIFIYLLLHVLGAYYLYSNVPYDEWSQRVLGINLTETFGWKRNHYDRLVHFSHGLLLLRPMCELVQRWLGVSRAGAITTAFAWMAVLSSVYELAEWLIAVFMSPEAADKYNGQQGDVFDAQKDMALAMVGSVISAAVVWAGGKGGQVKKFSG